MVYLNTIPAANDDPADSQSQLLENFAQLETQFNIDHNSLVTGGANQGEHLKVSYTNVLAAGPGFASPKAALYTKADAVSGFSELFFETRGAAAALIEQQLTNLPITSTGTRRHLVTPWGIELDFGTSSANVAGTAINFQTAFTNNAFMLVLGVLDAAAGANRWVKYSALTVAGFNAFTSNNGLQFSYFAIGN